jgi:hypothetical protein
MPDKPKEENKMNTVKQYSVNEQGLNEIKGFLSSHHKKGGDYFTRDMLYAWTTDAEFSLQKGNQAFIEIRAWDAVSGRTETFTISDAGIDCDEIEIE